MESEVILHFFHTIEITHSLDFLIILQNFKYEAIKSMIQGSPGSKRYGFTPPNSP